MMANLTFKRINEAVRAAGMNLTLVRSHPYYWYDGPGVEFIHGAYVMHTGKLNDLPLEKWIEHARRIADRVAEAMSMLNLPDHIRTGREVVIATPFGPASRIVESVRGDGRMVTVKYQGVSDHTWLWYDGSQCSGPVAFRDQAAYDAAVSAQHRAFKALQLFQRLSVEKQVEALTVLGGMDG